MCVQEASDSLFGCHYARPCDNTLTLLPTGYPHLKSQAIAVPGPKSGRRGPLSMHFWTFCMSLLHLQLTPVTAAPTYEPRVAVTVTQRTAETSKIHAPLGFGVNLGNSGRPTRVKLSIVDVLTQLHNFSVLPLRERVVTLLQRQDQLRRSRECLSWSGIVGASLLCGLKKLGIGSLNIPP